MRKNNVIIENTQDEMRVVLKEVNINSLYKESKQAAEGMMKSDGKYKIARGFLAFGLSTSLAGGYLAALAPNSFLRFIGVGVASLGLITQAVSLGFSIKHDKQRQRYTNLGVAIYREMMQRQRNESTDELIIVNREENLL